MRNQRVDLCFLSGLLMILAALTTFYILNCMRDHSTKIATHEIAEAWMFDTPLELMNSSAAGYQIFVFPFSSSSSLWLSCARLVEVCTCASFSLTGTNSNSY